MKWVDFVRYFFNSLQFDIINIVLLSLILMKPSLLIFIFLISCTHTDKYSPISNQLNSGAFNNNECVYVDQYTKNSSCKQIKSVLVSKKHERAFERTKVVCVGKTDLKYPENLRGTCAIEVCPDIKDTINCTIQGNSSIIELEKG